jgi:hypothetical protein
MRWSDADLANFRQRRGGEIVADETNRRAKFGNVRTQVGGRKFDSKLEASRWQELEQMQQLGAIKNLRHWVPFALIADGGGMVGTYVADYVYDDAKTGQQIVEDAKGMETPLFKWKARHFKAQFKFEITVVKRVSHERKRSRRAE